MLNGYCISEQWRLLLALCYSLNRRRSLCSNK
nr:MAG TPA: hypothetical protein [Inoviridae sp.]